MCYIVVLLRNMAKERWWSATDIKHRKHVKTCYLRDRVNLGFRDRVSVSLGLGLELRSGSVLDSPLSCILYVLLYPIFLTPNPKILASLFNLPPNLYYV